MLDLRFHTLPLRFLKLPHATSIKQELMDVASVAMEGRILSARWVSKHTPDSRCLCVCVFMKVQTR